MLASSSCRDGIALAGGCRFNFLSPVPCASQLHISFSHPAFSSDNESHLAFLSAEDRWNWLE